MNQPNPHELTSVETAYTHMSKVSSFRRACDEDPELRLRAQTEPLAVLAENGVVLPPGVEARIVENTPETFHLALPPDPNVHMRDEQLSLVAGGKCAGTVGCVGSAGTASTVLSTVSSASSAGSVASAGSASIN